MTPRTTSCEALKDTTLAAEKDSLRSGWQKCCVASSAYDVHCMAATVPTAKKASKGVSNMSRPRMATVLLYSVVALAIVHTRPAAVWRVISVELPAMTLWLL